MGDLMLYYKENEKGVLYIVRDCEVESSLQESSKTLFDSIMKEISLISPISWKSFKNDFVVAKSFRMIDGVEYEIKETIPTHWLDYHVVISINGNSFAVIRNQREKNFYKYKIVCI